jgi:integrase
MTERAKGVWRLRVVDGYDAFGRPHQRSKTVRGTKREAETKLAEFVADVDRGVAPASGAMTYGHYLTESWLPHVEATREPTTHERHTYTVRNLVVPALGRMRLDKLTTEHVDHALRQWEKTLQPSTVIAAAATVGASLEQAVRWGLIPRNPAKNATKPRQRVRKMTLPTIDQVLALIEAAQNDDPTLAACLTLAATTGMRRGELCGLRWRDVDSAGRVLTVETAVKRVTGRSIVGETKTHSGRCISLDDATLAMLKDFRSLRSTIGKDGDDDFLFTWRQTPTNPDALTMRFERQAAKVDVHCRLHDLRHAVATHLLSAGVDLAVVSSRLGHATPKVTLQVYAHALVEKDRQAAEVMAGLLKR